MIKHERDPFMMGSISERIPTRVIPRMQPVLNRNNLASGGLIRNAEPVVARLNQNSSYQTPHLSYSYKRPSNATQSSLSSRLNYTDSQHL